MSSDHHRYCDAQYRCRAFTYLELILVIAILGIVAGIAVPRFGNFVAHRHIDAAATRIATDLAFARQRAKFSGTQHKVMFQIPQNRYQFTEMDDPDHPGRPYVVPLAEEPYNATIISADFGGDVEVVFDGYGVPDSGGTLVLAVGYYRKTLTLDAQTGRVTVSDLSVEIVEPELPEIPPEQQE